MYTVIETEVFKRYAEPIWNDTERLEFITWLVADPWVGDVIPGTGGLRKVRWSCSGIGKRGGTRVIYYNLLSEGLIWLLIVYTKAKIRQSAHRLSESIERGNQSWTMSCSSFRRIC